ncbi:hypothetical protein [Ilyomonas limi]|nr:hypothetical protein [Ilyomonas limi]
MNIINLVRASNSADANYIEPADSLGIADEKMNRRIAAVKQKESIHC